MIKKYIAVLLAFALFLPANIIFLAGSAEDSVNQALRVYEFTDDFRPAAAYSDAPAMWNGVAWNPNDYPYFKGTAEGVLRYTTLEDTNRFTAPGAGQPYPCINPSAPAYARLNMADKPYPLSSDYVNQNVLGFKSTIHFSSGTEEMPAGFANTCFMLRYGAATWVNGVTNDFRLWYVTSSGVLKIGGYTQQLELDRAYDLFILVDQRGDNRIMDVYIDGELVAANQTAGEAGASASEVQKKLIAVGSYVVWPSQKNAAGSYEWRDVDFSVGNAGIYAVSDINAVSVIGDDVVYIGASRTSAQYRAESMLGIKDAVWSVEPEAEGISIDSNGLLSVEPWAVQGEYTVCVSDGSGTVRASKTVSVEAVSYSLVGNSVMWIVPGAGKQKFEYRLESSLGEIQDAEFSFGGEYSGLALSGGAIISDGTFDGSSVVLQAELNGQIYSKTINVKTGKVYDFENTLHGWTKGGGGIENPRAVDENTGNQYFDPKNTRWNSPAIISDVISDGIYAAEFDFLVNMDVAEIAFAPAKRVNADGTLNTSAWWLDLYVKKDGDAYNVLYNGRKAGSCAAGWNHMKIVFDFDNKTAEVNVNGVPVTIPSDYFTAGKGDYDLTFGSIITKLAIDNFRIYGGSIIDQQIDLAGVPNYALIPNAGRKKSLELKATTFEEGEKSGAQVIWSLVKECDFASINGNVLTYDENAEGTITVKAQIKGTQVWDFHNITFARPEVSFVPQGTDIQIKGPENAQVAVKVYGPKNQADSISKFLEAFEADEEGAQPVAEAELTLDAQGTGSYALGTLPAGKYRVYTALKGSEIYYDDLTDIGIETLAADSEATMNSQYFPAFMTLYGERSLEENTEAWQLYCGLKDKTHAADMLAGDFKNFYAAAALEQLLEQTAYNQSCAEKAETELKALGITVPNFKLLEKNGKYSEAAGAVSVFASLDAACRNLDEQIILKGIKNVINKWDVKAFLQTIGNARYNGATETQKTTIAEAVEGKTFDTMTDLHNAINKVPLSSKGGASGGGGGNAFVSGGSGVVESGKVIMSGEVSGSTVQNKNLFDDVNAEYWGYNVIQSLAQKKIINGFDGKFRPEDNITRAEFMKILVEAFGAAGAAEVAFDDVSDQHWCYEYLRRAIANGLVLGADGRFMPEENITREDAAVMSLRFAKFAGNNIAEAAKTVFTDETEISDYALSSVASLYEAKLIRGMGDGSFAPKKSLTRAEAAQMVYNIMTGGNG